MKQIVLPNKEFRLLSNQLQNLNTGYTVSQIRSLDKVVSIMETALQPFTDGLNKLLEPIDEKDKKASEEKQKKLDEFVKTEGNKEITCSFEDIDFEFIKLVWSRMGSFSGVKEAREAIIKIDNAIRMSDSSLKVN